MNRYSTEPEFILEQSGKTRRMGKLQDYTTPDYLAVVAELALLSQELNISLEILGRIGDSNKVLSLSLQEPL